MSEIQFTSEIKVDLTQWMGGDHMAVHAARVSTKGGICREDAGEETEQSGLINYLMKHRHGTPFEHGSLTFCVHAPILVWREWHRHRTGWCLSGDTEIWAESIAANCERSLRKRKLKDLCDVWNNGVKDSMGRVRFLPSVKNQRLRVLNEETGFFELGGIEDVFESGVKECLLIETEHKKGWSLRCSKDHRILTSEGWVKAGDLTGSEWVSVSSKKSAFENRQIPPSLRAGIGVWTSMQRASLIPKDADCYLCGKPFHRENLVLYHQIPVAENLKLALDIDNLKPVCISCHRTKSNSEQVLANRCNVAASRFVRLRRKPYVVSQEMTYDITMKGPWHNFVANGIVVHNSYNEESGRYKQLEPIFYIPKRDRPMMKVEGWKPGRPKFEYCNDDHLFNHLVGNLEGMYQAAYETYVDNLSAGFDPGLARDCLPVGIYSSCWCTCNPRSLMHFLSLRTHEPTAKQISYPLWEIEVAARQCETLFAKHWPLTHKAWNENGRVAP